MASTALLSDTSQSVLPDAPIRQWVLSLPYRLRYLLAWDHDLCRTVVRVYVRDVLGFLRTRARRAGIANGRCGAATIAKYVLEEALPNGKAIGFLNGH